MPNGRGQVRNNPNCPVKVFDYAKFYNGTIWTNGVGDKCKIIDYQNARNVYIQFLDEYGAIRKVGLTDLSRGKAFNPYHKNKYGGYIGEGEYTRKSSISKVENLWYTMLTRVFGLSENNRNYEFYQNVSVDESWLNFQNFATWYYSYISQVNYNESFQLDKDIYQWESDNKIYGPNTCCVIPKEINEYLPSISVTRKTKNNYPLGVGFTGYTYFYKYVWRGQVIQKTGFNDPMDAFLEYKVLKTENLHQIADHYRSLNQITQDVYERLYSIEIKPF